MANLYSSFTQRHQNFQRHHRYIRNSPSPDEAAENSSLTRINDTSYDDELNQLIQAQIEAMQSYGRRITPRPYRSHYLEASGATLPDFSNADFVPSRPTGYQIHPSDVRVDLDTPFQSWHTAREVTPTGIRGSTLHDIFGRGVDFRIENTHLSNEAAYTPRPDAVRVSDFNWRIEEEEPSYSELMESVHFRDFGRSRHLFGRNIFSREFHPGDRVSVEIGSQIALNQLELDRSYILDDELSVEFVKNCTRQDTAFYQFVEQHRINMAFGKVLDPNMIQRYGEYVWFDTASSTLIMNSSYNKLKTKERAPDKPTLPEI